MSGLFGNTHAVPTDSAKMRRGAQSSHASGFAGTTASAAGTALSQPTETDRDREMERVHQGHKAGVPTFLSNLQLKDNDDSGSTRLMLSHNARATDETDTEVLGCTHCDQSFGEEYFCRGPIAQDLLRAEPSYSLHSVTVRTGMLGSASIATTIGPSSSGETSMTQEEEADLRRRASHYFGQGPPDAPPTFGTDAQLSKDKSHALSTARTPDTLDVSRGTAQLGRNNNRSLRAGRDSSGEGTVNHRSGRRILSSSGGRSIGMQSLQEEAED
ncbi:hypothetical protein I316_04388 [Kwoniella heveanensis BCC8398]|uniref:Uncharacterized protein n=1 Tax=Kwoniella heveanensis BCC8398 TaxID=1296120 RepID=A0A1B9GSJ0_9TREE|nr:hypothetical protein I316_04388 [Kwoniella heveanensis BCC8398]